MKVLMRFLKAENGAELAEYAVGAAIVTALAIIVYQILGDAIYNRMIAVTEEIGAAPADPPADPTPGP